MISLKNKIQQTAKNKKLPQHVIEKDYALSYVLAGIASEPTLNQALVFKGGTALKKIFFGDYRFSEDLDFSTINAPKGSELITSLTNALKESEKLLNQYGPFTITLNRPPESAPHPQGQETFRAYVIFPWQSTAAPCKIKIEVTHDEPVVETPVIKPILHGYDESFEYFVSTYHIEEIIAEKMRCLLQTHEKLVTPGKWTRPRARDYYDLWHVLKKYGSSVNKQRLNGILIAKCNHRNISYEDINSFFTPELKNEAEKHWIPTLQNLVNSLPPCDLVLAETKKLIFELIS